MGQNNDWQNEWAETANEVMESLDWSEKLYLNTASMAELQHFGFDSKQAHCMLLHREKWGDWQHLSELQQCGISLSFIRKERQNWAELNPDARKIYLQEKDSNWWKPEIKVAGNVLPSSENPKQLSHLFKSQAFWGKWLRLSYISQTDAGETFNDFQAAAIEVKSIRALQHVVAGRFMWNWNQGLTFAAPFAVGRSLDLGSWVHNEQQLRAANSPNEDQGIWGLGGHFKIQKHGLYFSVGTVRFDARLDPLGTSFLQRSYGGLHVTDLEKSRRMNNRMEHLFLAWKRQYRNHAITLSHTAYRYEIPRMHVNRLVKQEFITEYQHTIQGLLGARALFNIARSSLGDWAYYGSAAWTLHPHLDLAFRTQNIGKGYYAPERSPYTQSENGKHISEIGFDFNPNNQHQFQLRSQVVRSLLAYDMQGPLDPKTSWIAQYVFHLNRNDYVQLRLRQNRENTEINRPQLIAQSMISLYSDWQLRSVFIWQKGAIYETENTLFLNQITGKIGSLKVHFYAVMFHSQEPLYLSLPSAQFPWRLGIFNGNGNAYGLVFRQRIHRKMRLQYSIEWTKKSELNIDQIQKPRIFVQLEIL